MEVFLTWTIMITRCGETLDGCLPVENTETVGVAWAPLVEIPGAHTGSLRPNRTGVLVSREPTVSGRQIRAFGQPRISFPIRLIGKAPDC